MRVLSRQAKRRIGPPGRWPLLSCVPLCSVQRIRAAHRPQPHVCGASNQSRISQIQARCSSQGQPLDRTQASQQVCSQGRGYGVVL
jgi:hypothetical protein